MKDFLSPFFVSWIYHCILSKLGIMSKRYYIFVVFILIFEVNCFAQKDRIGLNYGFQLGWYRAGDNEAKMYDCGANSEVNLRQILITNSTNHAKLQDYFNDDFDLYELPHDVQYKSTLCLGATLQYYLIKNFSIFLTVNYVSPTIKNCNFSVKLASKSQGLSDYTLEQGSISSKESRFNFELGLHKAFDIEKPIQPFVELTCVGSFLEMKEHDVTIGNLTQSVLYYSNNDVNNNFSKFGFGASCSGGIQFDLSEKFLVYLGINLSALHFGITEDTFSIAKSLDFKILL